MYARINNGTVNFVMSANPSTVFAPETAAEFVACPDDVQVGWLWDGEHFTPAPLPPLAQRQEQAWEGIKAERERRRVGGVKVGSHWFHSDDSSRIQQLALSMMGAGMPPGIQWRTLTLTPPPVFVEMTPTLAGQIFTAVAAWDQAVFAAAEVHRTAMEASAEPEMYDFAGGWPVAIWEE